MKVLKVDLKIPYWCSFGVYGTVNTNQTYILPHPPAIFGLIQNALGEPVTHETKDKELKERFERENFEIYSNLHFAIAVRNLGEKIGDYSNIHKRIRPDEPIIEQRLMSWKRTQINRERLIAPSYTIFICSDFQNKKYSLDSIKEALKNPERPLYLGQSDDVVDLYIYDKLYDAQELNSSNINSVIPGVYSNSIITKIPVYLRNQSGENGSIVCSIPQGDISKKIPSLKIGEDYVVFIK